MRRKWRAWRTYSSADRRLICEAALWLALTRFFVAFLPFRWLGPWLRKPSVQRDLPELSSQVGRAVLTASRHVPWQAACLPQALTAKIMLARRGQGSAVHLGAKLDEHGALAAHAWLTCGNDIVTGGGGLPGHTPLIQLG